MTTLTDAKRWLAAPVRHVAVSSWLMGAFWCAAMLARLFLGHTVGMADNGDGHRLMCQLGVAKHPLPPGQELWSYVTPRYDDHTWYGEACSAGGSGQPYYSTQWIPLWFAKLLTPVLGLDGALDLRALGVVMAVLFGFAIAALTSVLPLPVWVRVIVVSLIGLFTVDSAIAPYFISPLSEPAVIIGMLFVVAAVLRMLRRNHTTLFDLALVTIAALWTIGAKTQTITLMAGVLPAMLARPVALPGFFGSGRRRRAGTRQHRKQASLGRRLLWPVVRRVPALGVCAVLVLGAFAFTSTQSTWFKEIYTVHQVFETILPGSPDPKGDLRSLGVDPEMAQYSGMSVNDPAGPISSPHYEEFLKTVTTPDIVKFYATHPDRALKLIGEGLDAATKPRVTYLGNYLADSGEKPYARENRVFLGGTIMTMMRPLRWVLMPGLWIGSFALGAWIARHRRIGAAGRGIGWVLITLSVSTVAQFAAVLLSDGRNDIVKHMVFVVYGTFLLIPMLIAAVGAIDMIGRRDQYTAYQRLPSMREPEKVAPS